MENVIVTIIMMNDEMESFGKGIENCSDVSSQRKQEKELTTHKNQRKGCRVSCVVVSSRVSNVELM